MSAEEDSRALALAASVPENSRNVEIQRARRASEALFKLVNATMSHTLPTQTIAGFLMEYARAYLEREKSAIYGDAEARLRGEARLMIQAMETAKEGYERVMSGITLLPRRNSSYCSDCQLVYCTCPTDGR